MSTATVTRPTLREVILDALDDAYWYRKGEIEDCRDCTRNPAGICGDHEADNDLARSYEEARRQLQQSPGHPEVLAVLAGTDAAAFVSGTEGGEGQ